MRQRQRQRRPPNSESPHGHLAHRHAHPPFLHHFSCYNEHELRPLLIFVLSGLFGFALSTAALLLIFSSFHTTETATMHHREDSIDLNLKSANVNHSGDNDNNTPIGEYNSNIDTILPHWEWHRYHDINHVRNYTVAGGQVILSPKYLIVQMTARSSSNGTPHHISRAHEDIVRITSVLHRAYSNRRRIDYATVTCPRNPNPPNSPNRFSIRHSVGVSNYISILRNVSNDGSNGDTTPLDPLTAPNTPLQVRYRYHFVWMFADPSTMVVDFERSIFDSDEVLLTSLSTDVTGEFGRDASRWFETNASLYEGALLWNTRHEKFLNLLDSWERTEDLSLSLTHLMEEDILGRGHTLWSEIWDDTSILYHFPLKRHLEMGGADRSERDMIQGNDIGHSQVEGGINTTRKTHRARDEEPVKQGRNSTLGYGYGVGEYDVIRLQSLADLVCFRYFPSCDIL